MNRYTCSIVLFTGIATLACGGGSGNKPAGTGGSTSVGGSGGTQADAGSKGTGGATINGDAMSAPTGSDASKGGASVTIGTCPTFTPCGGDLVGTWHLVSECLSTAGATGPCASTRTTMDLSSYDLSFTFAANGTASFSISGVQRENTRYSAACLGLVADADAGVAKNCADLQQEALQSYKALADAGSFPVNLDKYACSVDASETCVCDMAFGYPNLTMTGTYTIEGNQLVAIDLGVTTDFREPSGTAERLDYCISGNTMTLRLGSAGDSTMTLVR